MNHMLSRTALLVLAPAVLFLGCTRDEDANRLARTACTQLTEREAAHHAAVTQARDMDQTRVETLRYAADMHASLDQMMSACEEMMDSQMMGSHGVEQMQGMTDRMRATIDEHRARMGSFTTLDSLRAECETHHTGMEQMLGDLSHAMPGVGMDCCRGGGMM